MRPTRDQTWLAVAEEVAKRSTCHRRAVGCVLTNARGHVLSTGYNGRAADLPNCNELRAVAVNDLQYGLEPVTEPFYPHRCPNSDAPAGQPNGCESVHAEQNALMQCGDVYKIDACYTTIAPCLVCVKLLLNTSCRRIVFAAEYAYPDAPRLWKGAGRSWELLARG